MSSRTGWDFTQVRGNRPNAQPAEPAAPWLPWLLAGTVLLGAGGFAVNAAVDARRPKGSDHEQIRFLLVDAQRAAERRDAPALNRWISEDYSDDLGLTRASVCYEVGRYLRSHRTITVVVPQQSLAVEVDPTGQSASAQVHASIAVESQAGRGGSELDFSLRLRKEPVHYFGVFPGQEWRITWVGGYTGLME
jgi:hypothetical protein